MKSFSQFISEESSEYEKAWDKHVDEMKHLKSNDFEPHFSNGTDSKNDSHKGMQRGFRGEKNRRASIDTTHRQSIYWKHNNNTRKNHSVVTSEVVVDDEGTPNSMQSAPHRVEHENLKAAVSYLNDREKQLAKKK
jgi:hypothetical protein